MKQNFDLASMYWITAGCGPGYYTIAAAELVGPSGKVYALDIHSLAIQEVKRRASKKRLTNIETVLSDGATATGLTDRSINTVLLYDAFHDFSNQNQVLKGKSCTES
jgi:ubiquinone/menaquinone biosynthesis C-methylase UbiE